MTDLVFHKAEKYIQEDLEYYFSGERDIHSQVKPGQNIYSFVPDSRHLKMAYDDGKIGNLFYPFAPGTVDRIYIGISFPLFANNWGAALLRHLMTLVKPGGCVVLPVYPEMQASEKNYWSRSILENIFISRSRWKGMSNIWAENDGVMSMRIGRKRPPHVASTANYLLRQGSQAVVKKMIDLEETSQDLTQAFIDFHLAHWHSAKHSAIVEKIIQDQFGRKTPVAVCSLGEDAASSLVALECALSPYINVKTAVYQENEGEQLANSQQIKQFYHHQLANKIEVASNSGVALASHEKFNVISLLNSLSNDNEANKQLVKAAWQKLASNGLLIVREGEEKENAKTAKELTGLLSEYGSVKYYSAIAASEHLKETEISHYSLLIEEELRQENSTKEGVFWVLQKS